MPSISASSTRAAGGSVELRRAAGVLSTGSFAPDASLTNAELEALVATSDTWIRERTGIRERRRAGSGMTAAVMAAEAGRRALDAAGVSSVDVLIVATCTGDTAVPSTACLVQQRLGLSGIPAFDINAACTGYLYGLILARSLITGGSAGSVLVIGSEALTSLVDYRDRSTCVLFGDGAGATVVGGVDEGGIRAWRWAADGSEADLIYYGTKQGFADVDGIRMAGAGTFRLAVERLTEVAAGVCADAGWEPADIDLFVPHQANLRIIEAVARRLGLPMERVMVNIDRFGNTSAASIPLALAEADAQARLRSGDRVLFAAFGAGITWGAVALEWNSTAAR